MRFSSTSEYMLKYQKAKAKLVEYGIQKKDYPKFPLNSNELSYPVIYILSRYAESIIEKNEADRTEFYSHLKTAAQYFDAAVGSNDRSEYDEDFLLSGAAAYFLCEDFGSAKVMAASIFSRNHSELKGAQKVLSNFFAYLLLDHELKETSDSSLAELVSQCLHNYYATGKGLDYIYSSLSQYREEVYASDDSMGVYYVDILFAVVILAISKSSWTLLPIYSALNQSQWTDYLKSQTAIKMFWPAQQLIGETGILTGNSAIVQLPTGVGKTKSIELIVRSSFVSNRTSTAIIIAPLRALCNEIANDMVTAFGDEILVNQFSDILEDDFSLDFSQMYKPTVMICTPEKLSYIVHHQADFLGYIGLYIFDEGHMFDDGSRGAIYELLISEIRRQVFPEAQLVLLSAVLSNADDIKDWLFGETGVLASDARIKATPKAIGFTSQTRDLHYFSDNNVQEDFFVPHSIEVVELRKHPKEKKTRYFPNTTDEKDVAIYYANKLCKNGGAAVFANRVSTIQKVLGRIVELYGRGHYLTEIKNNSNKEELSRLAYLMSKYYGENHIYTFACFQGAVPHYSNLPNGLRIAIEHGFRKRNLCFVVCTSTLAQGVNIPIKYLFMTSFRVARDSMQVRNFQNLMGRTARSGMYTEGSIIVTDSKLFDNKQNNKNGGNYKWADCKKMFDSSASEPCGSSILSLVQNIVIDYNTSVLGEKFVEFVIEHYDQPNCFELYSTKLFSALHRKFPNTNFSHVTETIRIRKNIIMAIENYLCFVLASDDENKESVINNVCQSCLAYYMANDKEKILLEQLFNTIVTKVQELSEQQIKSYAKTMIGMDLSSQIQDWIIESGITQQLYTNEQIFDVLIPFYLKTHTVKKNADYLMCVCQMWLEGYSFAEMSKHTSLPILELEDICSKTVSYELSFFIGNIIDIIEAVDKSSVNPVPILLSMQKRMKYGVQNGTAVSICEKVFNDRFLANRLAAEIGLNGIEPDNIVAVIKTKQEGILNILTDYPSYFSDRIEWLCKD